MNLKHGLTVVVTSLDWACLPTAHSTPDCLPAG